MNKIKISDHALVRYFERFVGLDINKFKEELSSEIAHRVKKKKGRFKTKYGVVVVEDWTVLTLLTHKQEKEYKKYNNIS